MVKILSSLNNSFSWRNRKFSNGLRKDVTLWSYHNTGLLFSNIKCTDAEHLVASDVCHMMIIILHFHKIDGLLTVEISALLFREHVCKKWTKTFIILEDIVKEQEHKWHAVNWGTQLCFVCLFACLFLRQSPQLHCYEFQC